MGKPAGQNQPYALKSGEGWIYRLGINFTVKASEVREGSGAAFMEYTTRKGEEPSEHTHLTEDEMFYVLQGSLAFRCGEQTYNLGPGGFVFLPHGMRHGYTILSDDPVKLIIVTCPTRGASSGGWGGFVSDLELGQGELIAKPKQAG